MNSFCMGRWVFVFYCRDLKIWNIFSCDLMEISSQQSCQVIIVACIWSNNPIYTVIILCRLFNFPKKDSNCTYEPDSFNNHFVVHLFATFTKAVLGDMCAWAAWNFYPMDRRAVLTALHRHRKCGQLQVLFPLSHTRIHTRTHTQTLFLSHTHTHTHTLSLFLSHTHTHTHTHTLFPVSFTYTYAYTHSLFHTHTQTHTQRETRWLRHTCTRTHTHREREREPQA